MTAVVGHSFENYPEQRGAVQLTMPDTLGLPPEELFTIHSINVNKK